MCVWCPNPVRGHLKSGGRPTGQTRLTWIGCSSWCHTLGTVRWSDYHRSLWSSHHMRFSCFMMVNWIKGGLKQNRRTVYDGQRTDLSLLWLYQLYSGILGRTRQHRLGAVYCCMPYLQQALGVLIPLYTAPSIAPSLNNWNLKYNFVFTKTPG